MEPTLPRLIDEAPYSGGPLSGGTRGGSGSNTLTLAKAGEMIIEANLGDDAVYDDSIHDDIDRFVRETF